MPGRIRKYNMFKFEESAALAANTGNSGSKVLDSGCYPMTIDTVSETIASTGTKGFDFSFLVDGSKWSNKVYGVWHTKSNGDDIKMNSSVIQNLMGLTEKKITMYDKTIEVKDGTKVVKAVKEFDGFKGYVAIVKVLDFYNGEVREKNEIRAFMNEDKKTYAETVKNSDAKQFAYYTANLKDTKTEAYKKAEANGEIRSQSNTETEAESAEEEGSLL